MDIFVVKHLCNISLYKEIKCSFDIKVAEVEGKC